jgi:hypothetical protein
MNRITAMYKLEILSSEVREKNKLRPAIYRRDCTLSSGDYKGIEPFMNKKGMFFLSLAEILKTQKTLNLPLAIHSRNHILKMKL